MTRWTIDAADPANLVPIFQDSGRSAGTGPLRQTAESLLTLDAAGLGAVGGPAVVYSGSLAEIEGGGLFDAHPGTWGPRGWAAMEGACERAARGSACVFAVRPHARHVVSDVPGVRRFGGVVASRLPGRFRLLLDPPAMLDVSHLERHAAEDHLRRIAAEVPTLDTPEFPFHGLVVTNVRRVGDRLCAAAIDDGEVDPGLIRELFLQG